MSAVFFVQVAATALVGLAAVGLFRWVLFDKFGRLLPVRDLFGKTPVAWGLNAVAMTAIVAMFAAAIGVVWTVGQ